eukprot:31057-Pelagococcus_subviridis.AAC.5
MRHDVVAHPHGEVHRPLRTVEVVHAREPAEVDRPADLDAVRPRGEPPPRQHHPRFLAREPRGDLERLKESGGVVHVRAVRKQLREFHDP